MRQIASCTCAALCAVMALASVPPAEAQIRPNHPQAGKPRGAAAAIPPPDDVAGPPADAERTESGLAFRRLHEGSGTERPGINDAVLVRYTGWTTEGAMFDTSGVQGKPRQFRVSKAIRGFTEAVQLLTVGEKRRYWIPPELAYGGIPGRPQGTLVFEVELVEIIHAPDPPMDLAEVPDDAVRTESGLAYRILVPGTGTESPGGEDTVLVHQSAWNADGVMIDSSRLGGEPNSYSMHLTIPAFREAFSTMVQGERRQLWAPEELTVLDGEPVHRGLVVFDVELIDFLRKPATPRNVAAPPPHAVVTDSGLAYEVLRSGDGEASPGPNSVVEVLYAGWTRDGRMFDASYSHGRAGRFTLDQRMPLGWNEALRMMVVGEKRRIWIPEMLAYGGRSDRPAGMLIFEVELLSFENPAEGIAQP